ncbi:hypothetical protein PGT21_014200 [Puccinia graminis f. sp. tritici]|uniref:Uncharacterized protein n=1 Tax=Puccinia graminis f. sp. tritici TaxID=56615 RepID=A0A5B0NJ72_PUCGR|nr:hypothetical protein PGT21_014200 [Puccinia graminis f. sp. tritici]
MSLCYSSSFEELSILINCVATISAMLDWTLDPNPSSFLSPPGAADQPNSSAHTPATTTNANTNTTHDSSNVPIILRYALQSLATLKPPNIDDLIHEAAVEFHLDPRSIYLAISINQCPVKISLSLYRRIAPLSTIYVQHHTPAPIFNTLQPGGPSEPLSGPDTSTSTSSTNTTSAPSTTAATSNNGQTSNSRPPAEQAIHDFLNSFATASTVQNPPQPAPINDPSSAVQNPLNGSSPPTIASLLSSSIPPNGLDSSQPSSSTAPGGPNAITAGAFTNQTNQQNMPTTTGNNRTSKKRFLINSLASANTLNQHPSQHQPQQRGVSQGHDQDPSQSRRSKFPFLANRRPSAGSPSSSSTLNPSSSAISIADSPSDNSPRFSANGPPSSHDPSNDIFSMDLFNSLSSSS